MAVKRAFFFGCSFTNYSWPTWADAVGHTLHSQGYEYYNFGLPGSGNDLIFKTMLRASQEYHFTSDDLVFVMWTSWNREDRYTRTENGVAWQLQGNVLNNHIYDDEFISKHWSMEHDIITSISAISAARRLFDISFESSIPVFEGGRRLSFDDPLITELEKVVMPNPMVDVTSNQLLATHDGHPDIPKILEYLDQVFTPATGIHLESNTRIWLNEFNQFMLDAVAPLTTPGMSLSLADRMWRDDISFKIMNHHADNEWYRMPESAASMWCVNKLVNYMRDFSNQVLR